MTPIRFGRQNSFVVFFLFLIVGFIAFGNTLSHPFVHDDVFFIVNNPRISNLSITDVFRFNEIGQASSDLINVYYRPLVDFFHRLEFRIFGLNPMGFHLMNVLVHIGNAFLLYLLFNRWKGVSQKISIGSALLFLVHPIQTEAVACISGVSNLLLMFFFLSCFLMYMKSREQNSWIHLVSAIILFLTGCFIKEQMIVLPFLILLYEATTTRHFKMVGGLFAGLAVYFFLRKILLGSTGTIIFDANGEYVYRFMAIPRSVITYLSIIVFPKGLHYYRSLDILQSNAIAWIIFLVITAVLLTFLIKSKIDHKNLLVFSLGWFFLTLSPMLNIIPLVNEYSSIVNFEHFLYIPIAGLLLFLMIIFGHFLKNVSNSPDIKLIGFVCLAILCVAMTIKQNTYWRSEIVLFERSLKYQESARVRILLAKAYYFQQEYERAISEYEQALSRMKNYMAKTSGKNVQLFYQGYIKGIYFDLAHCYEALKYGEKAVTMYLKALELDPQDITLHNNLAVIFIKSQDFTQAITYLEQALTINPGSPLTRQNLAYCYAHTGQKDRADRLLQQGPIHP